MSVRGNILNHNLSINLAGIYYCLYLCLFMACFLPDTRLFQDDLIRSKWLFTEIFLILLVMVQSIHILKSHKCIFKYQIYFKDVFAETLVTVAFIEAVYALIHICLNGLGNTPVNGTFDNPAGLAFCLCIALPFHGVLWDKWAQYKVCLWLLLFSTIMIASVILLTASRTGWICVGLYSIILLQKRLYGHDNLKVFIFVVLTGTLLWAVWGFKQDSTSGRFFILERSWDMIQDSPIKGYGIGGFLREYMLCQADYFKSHTGSDYAWFASEIFHPLNEFVWIWIEFGLLGVLLVVVVFIWSFISLYRKKDSFSQSLFASLCGLFVFSCFSYPFKYPLGLVLSLCILICVWVESAKGLKIKLCKWRILGSIGLFLSVISLGYLSVSCFYEYRWNQVAKISLRGYSKEMMPEYKKIYGYYYNNPFFLYNYTSELFYAEQYETALKIAKECFDHWPSYNLSLLTGDICRSYGKYKESLYYYELAQNMCPNRFAPLEGLYYSYKALNDFHQADSIATLVKNKKIKINSVEVQRIIDRIKRDSQ